MSDVPTDPPDPANEPVAEDAVVIRLMDATDLRNGFLETLEALTDVRLTPEQAVAIFQKRMRWKVQTFVALLGQRVVGTASLLVEPKFIHCGGMVGHIEDIAVLPAYQKHGVGGKLVRYLLEVSARFKCYKVVLDCSPSLIPYYERHGFHQWSQAMRIDLIETR